MESPNDENRVRFLKGRDPTPAVLQAKLEEVGCHFRLLLQIFQFEIDKFMSIGVQ